MSSKKQQQQQQQTQLTSLDSTSLDSTSSFSPSPSSHPQNTTSSAFALKQIAILVAIVAITLALFRPLRNTLPRFFSSAPASRVTATSANRSALSTPTMSDNNNNLRIERRPWNVRGHADHGWLYTFHTFSFASYHSPSFESFGPLRVINEDRVLAGTGFGTHAHREFLIWSYVVSGELEHRDSMNNLEKLRRGEVQFTCAGTGIRHSEYNRNEDENVHFLQIWAKPNKHGLTPSYKTRKFADDLKTDKLCRIMEGVERHDGRAGEADPIPLDADLSMDASILAPGKKVVHDLVKDGDRNIYLHVVMTGKTQPEQGGMKIKIGDVVIAEGDGAFVTGATGPGKIEVESVGDKPAEFLLFDMGTD